jgi:glucose-1-phosphate cytidylyltransferase
MNNKTAIILCGGKGTRLGSLSKKIPKCLVKIHSYPIIWFVINILKKNSFNHFILPVGYKGEMIKNYIKKDKILKNLNIEIIDTGVNSSIALRIFKIKNKILSNNFVLLNGDAILDFNLKKKFENHQKNKFDMTFLACEAKLNFGIVGKIKNKIISFEREINFFSVLKRNNKKFIAYVYSGISIINKKILSYNFKDFDNFEKSFYPLIIKNYKTNLDHIHGSWNSIDNMKDVKELNNKNNKKKFIEIDKIIKKIKNAK